jgi:hypothetical protein
VDFVGYAAQGVVGHRTQPHANFGLSGQNEKRAVDFRRAVIIFRFHYEAWHVVVDFERAMRGFNGCFENRRIINITLMDSFCVNPFYFEVATSIRVKKFGEYRG